MKVVWDEPKRLTNIKDHGYDPDQANEFDWDGAIVRPAKDGRRGEKRFLAIGPFRDGFIAIVFSFLVSEAISVISMRPASRSERRFYARAKESFH